MLYGIEDEGEQLTGIWVAKFEASSNSSAVVENPLVANLGTDGGSATDTELKIRVKPNVTSWRAITVNNIFTVCRNLTETGNSLENTSQLEPHMMKNTEWGAVAYLSRSVYGKNDEVWNNPYYNSPTGYSPITGLCGKNTNAKDLATTNLDDTCKYNEINGGNASTTGNVYGVYDMAGGAWEYVAGVLYKGVTPNGNINSFWDSNNSKYIDLYTQNTGSYTTYYGNTSKYGDAVYETSSTNGIDNGSWESTFSWFPYYESQELKPIFKREGRANGGGSFVGVFAFANHTGEADTGDSFRPTVFKLPTIKN